MWLGIYALLENEARTITDWHYALLCHSDGTEILQSAYAKAAAVSAVTGREYATLMYDSCYARVDFSTMLHIDDIDVSVPVDNSVSGKIHLTYLPSIVSGGLVNGTVVDTYDVLSHLSGLQVIHPRGIYTPQDSFRSALRLTNLYREFGHDIVWERSMQRGELRPYGAVYTSVIDPYSMGFESDKDYAVELGYNTRREGRSNSLPMIDTLFEYETVTVAKLKPTLTIVEWKTASQPIRPAKYTRRLPVKNEFKIRTGGTSNRVLLRSMKALPKQAGFQGERNVIAPLLPTTKVEGEEIPADTISTLNDA
jgi:hypothetical protein